MAYKISGACINAKLPEPDIKETQRGIQITFLKDIYTEGYLKGLNLDECHIKAILLIKQHGNITNTKYQGFLKVSKWTASNHLQLLMMKGLIIKIGTTGKGTSYILQRVSKGAKGATKEQ